MSVSIAYGSVFVMIHNIESTKTLPTGLGRVYTVLIISCHTGAPQSQTMRCRQQSRTRRPSPAVRCAPCRTCTPPGCPAAPLAPAPSDRHTPSRKVTETYPTSISVTLTCSYMRTRDGCILIVIHTVILFLAGSRSSAQLLFGGRKKKQYRYRSVISDIFDGSILSLVQCLTCDRVRRSPTFPPLGEL